MIVVTWVLVTLRLLYHTISPKIYIVAYLWINLCFSCTIHLMVCLLDLTTNKVFDLDFCPLKVTQQILFWGQPGIWQFSSLIFHDRFLCLPDGKTTSWPHPGKFLKMLHFPKELGSPHWGTETGCMLCKRLSCKRKTQKKLVKVTCNSLTHNS